MSKSQADNADFYCVGGLHVSSATVGKKFLRIQAQRVKQSLVQEIREE